jgi:integral membrane protein (TIGR00529 family)
MIDMLHIPALIRILMAFICVILFIRKNISLGNAFLAGSIILSFLFGLSPSAMIKSMGASIIYPKTLSLAVIVTLILILSNSMETAGRMKLMLNKFQGLITNPRFNIIVFPALIGLLPMPGGAVFSAPMVKELGSDSKISPDLLSFINYWFRHIWEYCWPLYPGVLLSTILADINLASFMLFMAPITFLAVLIGYKLLNENKSLLKKVENSHRRPPVQPFLKEMIPILIVIFPGLGMGGLFSFLYPELSIAKEIGLIIALFLSIGWVWYEDRVTAPRIWKMLVSPQLLKMFYMVLAILIFKGILEDSHAVQAISRELTLLNIPLIFIVGMLPFITGIVSGITIAFVGSTFPILIPLINSLDPSGHMTPYIMLGMVCGFTGVLLSPVHLCLILSNEYFGTTTGAVYKRLFFPCGCLIISSIIYFYLLHNIF